MTDLLAAIRAAWPRFRKSERKVAECVLKDPEAMLLLSITDLAETAGTSDPTVTRFCRRLGLSGYMEFKMNLARDLPSSHALHENVTEGDTVPEIFNKLLAAAREAITETMNNLDQESLRQAVEVLASARRLEIYGVGGSAVVARDAHHKFFRLGLPCVAYDDPHMQIMSAALLGPQDVVLAVSHTGSTKDVVESAKVARKAGATVIGILGTDKSPLAKVCHVTLSVRSHEAALLLAPMASRLVQLAVVDVLFVSVAMRQPGEIKERLDKVKRALVDKRY
ncbi:MAG: MurR/RpiR family transcriptional regulator [Thermodesulfobacteriota bacterium]